MKKALITSVTAFAIILSAGTSTAGPLGDLGQHGFAPKVHSSVSQSVNHADGMTNTHHTTHSSGFDFDLHSERQLGQNNLSATLQNPAINSNWDWDFPDGDMIGIDAGEYTTDGSIHLNWEQNQDSQPLGQSVDPNQYLIGSVFIVAAGMGFMIKGLAELTYEIACPRGNLGPAECFAFWNAGKLGPVAM
ncbi:hypothetical protein [uncultured Tateyamaria sp.]|uniref:hypothetical protein n=1 Tax=uncultured Tateyamaria sp. TaxID=455651 RepID=UPI0026387988|nr:hypothetical protein [uncultured Tateyamaria sp.]